MVKPAYSVTSVINALEYMTVISLQTPC